MKRIEKEVSGKNEYIRSISGSESLKQMVLSFTINTAIKNLISDIPNFGKIKFESIPSNIELTTRKQKQAQMMVTIVPSRLFENINLKLQQTIDTKRTRDTYGTCLLPDRRIVYTSHKDFGVSSVMVLNANGSLDFEVLLPSSSLSCFDVTNITDNNTLAVSSGWCQGIRMINLNDETISDIVGGEVPACCYVATFSEKFCHTNPNENTVKCYDLKCKLQWTFENKTILQTPGGITVDSSGRKSNNVIIISSDGKQHRQLLSGSEGLFEPWAIYFSKEGNMLIVANKRGEAFLYSVN
ncbi:unnamed protein product [Mytilus edulis]|uniref:Uncharacterized protein n=1 Tax=Mytilus edulis TaxID=6550 RepID=A0A8S3QD60_MYTED|nr:unnamed protein product [Mytilus edulis]